ncbi:STP1 protein [Plasmodium malariae]|uniref:STP1 protein n=1 Tax=Plasmodium malariae TaxID=5858 RepID=A0A1A8WU79_PLAMA|nr:STP1 protein [Plasmodium malariae]
MENCATTNYAGLGYGALRYVRKPEFIQAQRKILSSLASLKKKKDKNEFKKECLQLNDYLIKLKDKPPKYTNPNQWVPVLRNYFKSKFDELTEHGGCPMIFEQNERDLLELKYDALDFCETIKVYEQKLSAFKEGGNRTYNCNSNADCLKHCTEYKDWFTSKKGHFQNTRNLISKSCIYKSLSSHFPTKQCNILNTRMLNKVPECICIKPEETSQPAPKEKILREPELVQIKSEVLPVPQEGISHQVKHLSDSSPDSSLVDSPDGPPSDIAQQEAAIEGTTMVNSDNLGTDTHDSITQKPDDVTNSSSTQETLSSSIVKLPGSPELEAGSHIKTILAASEVSIAKTPHNPADSKIQDTDKKDKFLSDGHLDQPICDDKEIIKKLKIYEHNTIKNTNMLKRKKERSKTIIEVHMEVLEEFRNDEWELNKGEFLAICLEIFKNEERRSYSNLINDYQMENIQCSIDNEEKNILWNKWIERHRNHSEKFKKEDWFNNLKNEWKKEKSKVKKMEELKNKSSNENQKFSFLGEKDIWRQWISNKGKIVEHYLEQYWFMGLTDEFDNILDEYENEETKNSVSLINVEEMEHNKSCEELYKYVKKKLLEKLCILVFMMILEECIKEERIDNRESYFDNSINESFTMENSDRKSKIAEETTEEKSYVLEHKLNEEIRSYKGQNCFTQELEDWIKDNDSDVCSTYKENNIDKLD